MKILSINLNNFGGRNPKPLPKKDYYEWKSKVENWRKDPDIQLNAEEIKKYIYNNKFDIVIVQEFDCNSTVAKSFTSELNEWGYEIVYPNSFKEECGKGDPSITAMFIKYEKFQDSKENFSKTKRSVEIKLHDYRIVGVHVPLGNVPYWNSMIDYYKCRNNEKLLFIGDMNVFDSGTPQKKKFNELLGYGAIDAWIESGESNSKSTAYTGKRIDYALMTPSLYSELIEIKVDDTLRYSGVTDHSAIIVRFNPIRRTGGKSIC